MSETTLAATYVDAKNQVLTASNGVDYAYRSTGDASEATPLVTLQHFRGNLDNWDPALIDALAKRPSSDRLRQPGGRRLKMGRHRARSRGWRSTRSTSSMRWRWEGRSARVIDR